MLFIMHGGMGDLLIAANYLVCFYNKFIQNNETKIPSILKSMEEHSLCKKVGMLGNYNVYVLLKR